MPGTKSENPITVWDHDNWITDDWKIAPEIFDLYPVYTAGLLGIHLSEMTEFFNNGRRLIDENPGKYGWKIDGTIRAAAENDPFLYAQTSFSNAINLLRESAGLRLDDQTIQDLLNKAHGVVYQAVSPVFQPDAREFVEETNATTKMHFVSNSSTEKIYRRLVLLFGNRKSIEEIKDEFNVVGGAKKHTLDCRYTKLPETVQIEDLPRPFYPRRGKYIRTLKKIAQESPSELQIVGGDNGEMDLLAPALLGLNVILRNMPGHTLEPEVRFYQNLSRGHVVQTLTQAAQIVRNLRS